MQSEVAPYKYVSVEGPVVSNPSHDELALASRYLGASGRWYVEHNPRTESLTVRLRPERWRTFDFAKLF